MERVPLNNKHITSHHKGERTSIARVSCLWGVTSQPGRFMRGSGGGVFLHPFTRHYPGPTSARPDSITRWCPDPGAHPAVLNHRGRTCMHDCRLGVIDGGDDDCRLMSASAAWAGPRKGKPPPACNFFSGLGSFPNSFVASALFAAGCKVQQDPTGRNCRT